MKNRIWLLLIIVAACAVPTFGQTADPEVAGEDEGAPTLNQMCIDCDLNSGGGGGWSGSSTYDNGQYLDNPCTYVQDWVWVNYNAYAKSLQTEAGVNRYQVNESTTVSGAYATSGAKSSDVGYGATFSQRMYHKVNTPDNFHVVTVVTTNPSTKAVTLSIETACGNGMPDSVQ
jgi:hypothetical protein